MLEQFPSADSIAFETACGRLSFSADFNGSWQLTLSHQPSLPQKGPRSCRSSLSDAAALRFVIDHQNNSEGYDRSDGSNDCCSIPCILKTLEGVTDDYSHKWTESDVRRYALLLKLFGKPAADSGWWRGLCHTC